MVRSQALRPWGGPPIAWQGWALLAGYLAIAAGAVVAFGRPVVAIAIAAPIMVLLILIVARTTRGGWRWRKDL